MKRPIDDPIVEHVFVIEFAGATDSVLKLLGVFCVQACRLTHLTLEPGAAGAQLRVHVGDLGTERAAHLRDRLAALPIVRSVALGWRTEPSAAS